MTLPEERLVQRGAQLGESCGRGGRVSRNHLELVLAHLNRHRDVPTTLEVLSRLPRSCFSLRSQSTREQYEELERQVGLALRRNDSWQDAVAVIGWAKRTIDFFSSRPG